MFDQSWLELAELSLAQGNPDAAISYTEKMKDTNDERVLRLAMEAHYRKMLSCSAQYEWGATFQHAERVRECYMSLGLKFITFDPKYRSDARYYSKAARLYYSMSSGNKELALSALSELEQQEQRNENTHRDKILMALLKHYYDDEGLYDALDELIALVGDENYTRTLADQEPGEQFNYHSAVCAIVDQLTYNSKKKNINKAVMHLQRGISVIGDENIRHDEEQMLRRYRKGLFGWKYISP